MDTFSLSKLRDYIPSDLPSLPRLPTWSTANTEREASAPEDDDDDEDERRRQQAEAALIAEPITLTEPRPITPGPKSYQDLLNECDNFPYYHTDPETFLAHVNLYYALLVPAHPDTPLGFVLPSVAAVFKGLPDWKVDDEGRSLILVSGETEEERSRVVAATTLAMRETGHFSVLAGWRHELYPVYGPGGEVLFSIERAASPLFGVVTYGVHMTAYTVVEGEDGEGKREMKIWVPRRAASKQTFGGMLDNTVAGGIATGESTFESLVRECAEEASLPEEVVRRDVKAVGAVTYFYIRDQRAGGETRLLQPECEFVYDLELAEDVVPKPSDDEVAGFELMTVEEVKNAMRGGEFKPNCALVLLDFFVRHGILTAEEKGYTEIVARLHRRLEFPMV